MQFGILGPLEVVHDGARIPVGGLRQRAVLARLLLGVGRVIPADLLIEDAWDGRPPASAQKTLQKYVSELRKALPLPVLRTACRGYVLDVDADAIDAARFERLVGAGEPAAALGLWRGEVLGDLAGIGFVVPERTRLDELRLVAIEASFADALGRGRHAESVAELADLAAAHPGRERLTALLMLALYRAGRHVEALRVFDRYRRRLGDEVGVEPGPELRRLEEAILRHDPDLVPTRPVTVPARRSAGNLPLPLSSFVGRATDVAAIGCELDDHRLVTLTGPGGIGKTRLGLEVGRSLVDRFPGGVWLVDLAAVLSPDLVGDAVATALAIESQQGTDERAALTEALANRPPCLLLLDNCEHAVEACSAMVTSLLRGAPNVRVLATSRRPIGVDGEYVRPVRPLELSEARELFAERARLAGTDLAGDEHWRVAAEICDRLDGLPLAIELAASQLRVLAPGELFERLEDRLAFRGRGDSAPPRQRTLREMVHWSHEMLPPSTRRVYARLGVFASSLTLEGAEQVCADELTHPRSILDHVTVLVDHSFLVREPTPVEPGRYRLLETLRLYALELLAATESEAAARRAHARYYLDLAIEGGQSLFGPSEQTWRRRLDAEEPNLHAALAWTAEHDPELSLRLAVALWPYWDVRWGERHGVAHLTSLLSRPGLDAPDELRAWALTAAADMAANPGDARQSMPWAREAVTIFRRLGDERGLANALFALGSALGNGGSLDEADAVLTEAMMLARRHGDTRREALGLNFVSFIAARRGRFAEAAALNQDELACWTRLGSRRGEAIALRHLAVARQHLGDLDAADDLCRAALAIWLELDDPASVAHVRSTMADIARLRGDLEVATQLYEDALTEFRAVGDRRCTASTFKNLATLAAACGEHARSADLFRRGLRGRHDLGDVAGLAECLEGLACSSAAEGHSERAVTLIAAARSIRDLTGASDSSEASGSFDAVLTAARMELGNGRFTAAFDAGVSLPVPAAVEYALEPDDEGPVSQAARGGRRATPM